MGFPPERERERGRERERERKKKEKKEICKITQQSEIKKGNKTNKR